MTATRQTQRKTDSPLRPTFTPVRSGLLQRKCACGGTPGPTGECEACKKKRLSLQTKLKVNEPGDIYEQEADRIAEQVMATPEHSSVWGAAPRIQCQAQQNASRSDAAAGRAAEVFQQQAGGALRPSLRHDMEQRFGHDFSQVRVHDDDAAARAASAIQARAYTVGR